MCPTWTQTAQFQGGTLGAEQLSPALVHTAEKDDAMLEPRKIRARLWAVVIHSHDPSSCQAVVKVLEAIACASLVVGSSRMGVTVLFTRETLLTGLNTLPASYSTLPEGQLLSGVTRGGRWHLNPVQN